jgi:inner membrane protein
MFLFAHTGITLGAAAVIAGAVNRKNERNGFVSLSKYVDVRILMVGAMLPDIIDKPVGQYLFADTFHNGRIFSHTLLFFLLLAVSGGILYALKRQVWMLTLAFGTLTHLILDGMWGVPATFLWPLMGWKFASIELGGVVGEWFRAVVSYPSIYIGEIVGLVILFWYFIVVFANRQFIAMLRTGRVSRSAKKVPGITPR